MKIEQKIWNEHEGWQILKSSSNALNPHLVLVFGHRFLLSDPMRFEEIKNMYPESRVVLASTSGNILGPKLIEKSITLTAIAFESKASIQISRVNIKNVSDSFDAGVRLVHTLQKEGLRHIFVISDGHHVNGTDLVKGISSVIPNDISFTGGLAGDGTLFERTLVGVDEPPIEGEMVLIGFYGTDLQFGAGSQGGWDPFGIERKITRSSGNILYELDGKSALTLYKSYLGDQAKDLPGSALLFPLAIRKNLDENPLVRTILKVNEEDKSMVFAGDIPQGWYAQLMKANFDRLVDAASNAAELSLESFGKFQAELAILVSCVGRLIVLDQRVEEELEGVTEVLGKNTAICGFYSYGEIAPTRSMTNCDLHNQTMTITLISEKIK